MATLTWLGHASFQLDTDDGKRAYVDPWLSGPTCPDNAKEPERADLIAVTHGHGDHSADVVSLQNRLGCPVAGMNELMAWFSQNGIAEDDLVPFNKGGTITAGGLRITMTHAFHSSSSPDLAYTGEPAGFVFHLPEGPRIYFAGDTAVFGDMQLIARLYRPDVAVLPIGDHFTMGPEEAALALELLGNPRCVPCHWGTFPLLTGTPDRLTELAPGAVIERLEPGDSIEV